MATTTLNNGDTVMLLEASASSRPSWSTSASQTDALPYIDNEYGDPNVKSEVDRLIEEEMRRSSKTPSDYLNDLPPSRSQIQLRVITKEYERVRTGEPVVPLDMSKYGLDVPSQKNETAWKQALQKSQSSLKHQVIRKQAQAAELNEKIELVNRESKYHQQNAAHVLNDSSTQWKELCEMNIAIEASCVQIENYLEHLKAEAKQRGWSLDIDVENDSSLH
ncbi:hypothetical protein SSX86_012221 [Deinandra increscens subsp. villosa]|uniref:Pre-mRNA-splicing factor SPF27 n=1 Tax=Deinandra increscens subsp. villosa TaxID=3103831 RepID=A0AAP0D3T1_9ASTR